MKRLSAGVIGAGAFATYHARQYAQLGRVDLAGVWDPNAAAAQMLADELGIRAFESFDDLLAAVDMVTIASPAIYHAEGAMAVVAAGKHVYVEKPLAIDPKTNADSTSACSGTSAARITSARPAVFRIRPVSSGRTGHSGSAWWNT